MNSETLNRDIKAVFSAENLGELERWLDAAWKAKQANFGNKIRFYAPSFTHYKTKQFCGSSTDFPTISVTGKGCALKCKHCGGLVLETMHPATTSKELFDLCVELKGKGASGCLISGGCQPDGSVPLGKFAEAIARIKRELGLMVFVHTGIIDLGTATVLKNAGVDAALIDVIGSDATIREVYNMKITVDSYAESLRILHEVGMVFVPHVIVGLHHGVLKEEIRALKIIARYSPSALVIIAFMPIYGTEMQYTKPPSPLDIAKVMVAARLMFPKTPLVLGCMRPKGAYRKETDMLAIRAGVNAIAFPAEEAIELAGEKKCKCSFSSSCCAQIYFDASSLAVPSV
ncbi:MAG: radical SAM protein [Candidatus Bathyarchaeota archaeon]|nr:radical SAM protein [Candidatus Bathyarchaeota archaeon]